MVRRRLDAEMVSRGLARDVETARRTIGSRAVTVDGAPGLKPATMVDSASAIALEVRPRFVSRGGEKLHGALEDFGFPVAGMRCLDAGAGSGGFTDCLLQAGAAHVVAVDVGYGQFDWSLRNDPRVSLHERTNIRGAGEFAGELDLVVGDLSFVALSSLAATLCDLSGGRAALILLVKPQFEVPRKMVGPAGLVTDPAAWEVAIASAIDALQARGLATVALAASRLKGATGNQEFFLLARPGAHPEAGVISSFLEALK